MHILLRAIPPLSTVACFAVSFLVFRGPWGFAAAVVLTCLALQGLAIRQRARSGLPLLLARADRAAMARSRRVTRAVRRGDIERARAQAQGFPDTPVGRVLEVQSVSMVLFARGLGPEAVEVVRQWLRTHPHDDLLGRRVAHRGTEYAAMLLVLGRADAASVVPELRPAVASSTRAHRSRGCVAEFALNLHEGRVDDAAAQAYRWRRSPAVCRSRWTRAECECLIAICSAAAGDFAAADAALADAERWAAGHPALGPARARVAARAAAAVAIDVPTDTTFG
ncbi:hypothetical protein [Embleya sp. NPDC005971]|uniref:hypothetical protein n=1 Tax=unclassified Embleya TaxID=2699296 RepID=UPI0033EB5D60